MLVLQLQDTINQLSFRLRKTENNNEISLYQMY